MGSPTSRLLELLELLQARPVVTGREIADRLGVDTRTVRRYLTVLQELGIPGRGAARGRRRATACAPGYRLPPLMLGNDEAVVVVLGLLAARRLGLDTASAAAEGRWRRSTASCRPTSAGRSRRSSARSGSPPAPPPARPCRVRRSCMLADAVRRGRRVRATYRVVHRRDLPPRPEPVRARRPRRPLVPGRPRPRPGRPPHLPDRPDEPGLGRRWRRGCAPGGVRRGRARLRVAGPRAVDVGGRGRARPAGGAGGRARAGDAGRAHPRRRRDAPPHARRVARLDGQPARRPRLRVRRSTRPDELRASVRDLGARLAAAAV